MSTRGLCPFAIHKIIPPGPNDPPITPRAVILHVAVSMVASLFSFFRDRSGGIESHFYITFTGKIEQYRGIFDQADANLDANDFAVSIESAGMGLGRWNPLQMRAIKRLLQWVHEETDSGVPLRKIQHWDGAGVGYHTLFGAPSHWTPVAKSCPGPNRIAQFDRVLVPWMSELGKPPAPKVRKRAAWLANREKRGLARPLPLGSIAVNCMSGSGVSEKRSLAILARAAAHPGVDEIYADECANIATDTPLDPTVWDVVHDPSDPARAGSLYAVRISRGVVVGQPTWTRGCPGGFGIRARFIIKARTLYDFGTPNAWQAKNLALHGPPKRVFVRTPMFMAAVRLLLGDKMAGDWNRLARFIDAALPGTRSRFVGIVGHSFRPWIPVGPAVPVDVGGDHDAVFVTYWP